MAIKIHTPIRSIRLKCLDCSAGSVHEVRMCPCKECPLFPYRFGKRPSSDIKKQLKNVPPYSYLPKTTKKEASVSGDKPSKKEEAQ